MTRLVVISAGLGVPSSTRLLADRLTEAVVRELGPVELEVVELRPLARPLADHLLTGFPGPELQAAQDAVAAADALVVVSPVFAASYSGLFKMFFDLLPRDVLIGTPVLLGATAGSARHSLVVDHAMRPLFSYLRALVVPTAVFAATDDFGSDADLSGRITRAARELAALLGRRPAVNRPRSVEDELADPTPFEELIRRAGG
ncbi:CE1759 family FMN reductase [Nocardioides sp. 1609]|uniref:CE1759 family FMN reductase n=1 Tax=Nocardioides sp. 1609 TaxID=2508327 RepID=UPI00106F4186|nr:CE1759 family FMN reductase [Nocardioides sp. 1609]